MLRAQDSRTDSRRLIGTQQSDHARKGALKFGNHIGGPVAATIFDNDNLVVERQVHSLIDQGM
jgi:hypothetical protein